jgi:hypothetical protein
MHAGIIKNQLINFFKYIRLNIKYISKLNDKEKIKLVNLISFGLLNKLYNQFSEILSSEQVENTELNEKKIYYKNILLNIKYTCFNVFYNKFKTYNMKFNDIFKNLVSLYLENKTSKRKINKYINEFLFKNNINNYDIKNILFNKELFLIIYINILNELDKDFLKKLQNKYIIKKYLQINPIMIKDIDFKRFKMNYTNKNYVNIKINKIDSYFKGQVNEFFSFNKLLNIIDSDEFKILLDNKEKNIGLTSHYDYDIDVSFDNQNIKNIGKNNLIQLYEYLNSNGITATKGLIIGHVPRKEIEYISTIKDHEQNKKHKQQYFIFNIDNLLSRGQNNCEIIIDKNVNNNIIYKRPEILQIKERNKNTIISKIKLSDQFYKNSCKKYINIDLNLYNLPNSLSKAVKINN